MSSVNDIVKKLRENRILNEREDYSKYSRDELISLAQGGDQLASEILINNHQDFIEKMTKKYDFGRDYDREDIIQIGTLAFWDAMMKWDMTGNFEAYAGMIIKRRMVDELNKVNAEKRQLDQSSEYLDNPIASDDEGGEATIGSTISSKFSAEEEYLGEEGARVIKKFMEETLSEVERDVIRRYIQGYKVSEIAEETGMKYKRVENAIKRVKDKLAEYMRSSYKEAKKLRDSKAVEFTEEEKQVLFSILQKIDEKQSVREAKITAQKADYEEYTEEQLEEVLYTVEEELDDLVREFEDTPYSDDEREENLEYKLENISDKLLGLDEYLTDTQLELYDELSIRCSNIRKDGIEYIGDEKYYSDPYADNGVKRSDFF